MKDTTSETLILFKQRQHTQVIPLQFGPALILTFVHDPKLIWAGPSKKGAYGFSDIIRANYVDDVIYDVTLGDLKHWAQNFRKIL